VRRARHERLLRGLAGLALRDRPLGVVDAGAAGGLLPQVAPIASFVDAVAFDPDADECERLNAAAAEAGLSHRYIACAVTGSDGERDLHIVRKPSSSSLLIPDAAYHRRFPDAERMDVVRTVVVPTRSLGAVLDEVGMRPELLKLDVHGVEPEILESLRPNHWAGLLGVYIELLTGSHYRGQAAFSDVDPILRDHGFELFHLKRHSVRRAGFDPWKASSRGQLEYVDALYLRRPGDVDGQRFGLVASLFGHYDVALEALDAVGGHDAAKLVRALAARPSRVTRVVATQMIRVGELGRRWYGATGGWWSTDGPTDPL
jgi:FkbM family methyltransferase